MHDGNQAGGLNFFFDRNVSVRLARMIHGYDPLHTIEHHDDAFERTAADIDWMKALAARREGWFIVSGDLAILRNKAEAAVLRESRLTFFALKKGWLNLDFHVQACKLLKVWPKIVEQAARAKHPTVFEVPVSAQKIDRYRLTSEL
jgi:hypothetical protein